mgnify:CR=1 FL=1
MICDAHEVGVVNLPPFMSLGEQPHLEENESRADREFVERYRFYTDFPFSAEKIRHHLGEIIAQAADETNTPVVMATCHKQCELGTIHSGMERLS